MTWLVDPVLDGGLWDQMQTNVPSCHFKYSVLTA